MEDNLPCLQLPRMLEVKKLISGPREEQAGPDVKI